MRTRRVAISLVAAVFAALLGGQQDAPGPGIYKGRRIAATMHYSGAPWLTRESREREEECSQLLAVLHIEPGDVICDLGCGNGFYTLPLAERVGDEGKVLAVDIQPEMLELLADRAKAAGLSDRVEPTLGTLADPKLPKAGVDLILLVDVYHELSHPEQMLEAMRRSLKPNGRVVLVEFREEDLDVPIKPLHKMSKRQIFKELAPNGFRVVEQFDELPWQHVMFFERARNDALATEATAGLLQAAGGELPNTPEVNRLKLRIFMLTGDETLIDESVTVFETAADIDAAPPSDQAVRQALEAIARIGAIDSEFVANAQTLCAYLERTGPTVHREPERTGKKWLDMDYGPFLTTSVQCAEEGNIAHKGIAIPLVDDDSGQRGAMVFDTDLLRYAAGWTGGFLQMNGVVFDGVHGTFPAIEGEEHWSNPNEPGWADPTGAFSDPREFPWGPVPRAHARWDGLHLHGETVVLSYTVNGAGVLEAPGMFTANDRVVFSRTLEIGPATGDLVMQIAVDADRHLLFHGFDEGIDTDLFENLSTRVAALHDDDTDDAIAVTCDGFDGRAEWDYDSPGRIRLRFKPHNEATVGRILIMAGARASDPRSLHEFRSRLDEPVAPSQRIGGGPRRWAHTIATAGVIDIESGADERVVTFTEDQSSQLVLAATGQPAIALSDGQQVPDFRALPAAGAVVFTRQPRAFPEINVQTINRGLVGWWKFDEGQGDSSANAVHGQDPINFEGATWRRGLRDRSVEFNGTTSARIGDLDQFEFLDGPLTFAGWINTESDGTIFSHTKPDSEWAPDGKTFFVRDGRLAFDIGWVGVVESAVKIDDGRWHHVAFTWDNSSARVTLFVDGEQAADGVLRPHKQTTGHVARLAYTSPNFPQGGKPFSGKMDELRVYDRKLSDDELLFLATIEEKTPTVAAGVVSAPDGATWRSTRDGAVSIQVPAQAARDQARLLMWQGPADELDEFISLLASYRSGGGQPLVVDRLTAPDENPWDAWMRFGGFDFFASGTAAAVCTWSGDVWRVDGIDDHLDSLYWQRIATGLYQPLGLRIVDDVIYVVGRDQITRLHDYNGDGEADYYENFNNDTLNTEHFHEPCMDLHTDREGNFYYMKGGRHALKALHPHHGNLVRVSPDGASSELIGGGFRASNGLGLGPDGQAYGTDQEGYWMPANKITRVMPGGFHGNGWGWVPDGIPDTFIQPICWLHPSIDRSPSQPFWVNAGEWGLEQGSLFGLSYGTGEIYRVLQQEINGIVQGGITPTGVTLPTGVMRARVNPVDKQLYVCGLVGWSSDQTETGGFFRIRAGERVLHMPIGLRVLPNEIEITFREPLDSEAAGDPSNYNIQAWNYRWTERYGSPEYRFDGGEGRESFAVSSVVVSADGRTVRLRLPELRPVMQMHIELSIQAADGAPIDTYIHNTIHVVPDR